MKNPFPEQIKTIGIAAPAGRADYAKYEASVNLLRSFGLSIIEGKHLFEPADALPYLSAPDDERAEDLNALIRNPEVDLIICLRGGYGSMRILEKIDWQTLQERNLPITGFSDITALQLAMLAKNAGVPVAGQMAAAFANSMQNEETYRSFSRALGIAFNGKQNFTEQIPLEILNNGTCKGGIIPVNLTLLTALCGTPFMPDLNGKILVIEDIGEPVRKLDRSLTQLSLSGVLQNISGLIFAQFTDCEEENLRMRLFKDFASTVSYPVLAGLQFGHEIPSLSFVYNEYAEICAGKLLI